jgi:transitional endoplasmic reticulum ATPase
VSALFLFVLTAVLLPLVLSEFGDWCPWLAVRIVRWSARRLEDPAACARYEEEWVANLNEVPGKLSRLAAAIGYLACVPQMRWALRRRSRSNGKGRLTLDAPSIPMDAIGGYDDVKAELMRALLLMGIADEQVPYVDNLAPRGFIFHGPPGTGKTMFANAIASQLGATFLRVSADEIYSKYVGDSERKIHDLFAKARNNAPAVLLLDECDTIACKRGEGWRGGILAELLAAIDGSDLPVVTIAITNRIDIIDEALVRRLRPIEIGLPDAEARRAIARVHASRYNIPVGEDLLARVAAATEGMNGDEIGSIFRDAKADELVGSHRAADEVRLQELIVILRKARWDRRFMTTDENP